MQPALVYCLTRFSDVKKNFLKEKNNFARSLIESNFANASLRCQTLSQRV